MSALPLSLKRGENRLLEDVEAAVLREGGDDGGVAGGREERKQVVVERVLDAPARERLRSGAAVVASVGNDVANPAAGVIHVALEARDDVDVTQTPRSGGIGSMLPRGEGTLPQQRPRGGAHVAVGLVYAGPEGAMATVGRNDPCPCGSGAKYKKCCIDRDREASGRSQGIPDGGQVVDRDGARFTTSSGITDAQRGMAAEFFEQKRRGRGPAQEMADFSQPLIDAADGPAALQNALSLGAIFWNLAVIKDEAERLEMLEDLVKQTQKTEEDAQEFRKLAAEMVERHRTMFPEMHR